MGVVIGIDVGGSTTKIVGIKDNEIQSPMSITADDPVTSLFGAFGKYIYDNGVELEDIDQVVLTGVGSAYVNGSLYGLPTKKADEFVANGLGAHHMLDISPLVVVSMGTGTSVVKIEDNKIEHILGMGMGGGTVNGLSKLLLNVHDMHYVSELAQHGDYNKVDLLIGDVCNVDLPGLPLDVTASLFGKADTTSSHEDVASGIIHMVLQTIGSAAVLCSQGPHIKDFVLIGKLTLMPQCKKVFKDMENLYGVRFHIPEYSDYCTAIGAALSHIHPMLELQ